MKIIEKIKKIRKSNTEIHIITIGVIMVVCLLISLYWYSSTIKNNFQGEIETSLEEVANQSVLLLNSEINGKMNLLVEVSHEISTLAATDPPAAIELLKGVNERNQFKRLGIIYPSGETYLTDEAKLYLMDRDFYKQAIKGNRVISDTLTARDNSGKVNVFGIPIYSERDIIAVLFATILTSDLKKELAVSTFNGYGYSYIIKKNGDCVVDSLHPKSYKNLDNIFTSMVRIDEGNKGKADALHQLAQEEKEGYVKFENDGSRYMYIAPLGINDWNIVTVVSADVLDDKMNSVVGKTYLLSTSLILLFLIVIIYVLEMQKRNQKKLQKIAYVDEITGGYSYAKFQLEMLNNLEHVKRRSAVLSIDIDDFKMINGAFGYEEGDKLLCYIWSTLKEWAEKEELYARQSADVFVAFIYFDSYEDLNERMDWLCERLMHYNFRHLYNFKVIPSIGIYEIGEEGKAQDEYIDAARIARKTVKGKSDVFYAFYDKAVEESIYRVKEIESNMQDALKNREFVIYYQPKFDSAVPKVVGAEALVRWRKQDGSIIPPNEFITLFEKNGFITKLDSYVFENVCRYQKALLDRGVEPVPVSVNISKMHFFDLNFISSYMDILENIQLPVRYIQLEITESAFYDNQEFLVEVVNSLHNLGFVILLDDFGTGYSSMMMLKNLNIDILKVDKSFVDNIGDLRGNKIIEGVIGLAKSLDISVTAEGVETENQYIYLKTQGCNDIQGYYFARPMPEQEYGELFGK